MFINFVYCNPCGTLTSGLLVIKYLSRSPGHKFMNELNKAKQIELSGKARNRALVNFRKQIAKWGFAIPKIEPLVLDFGLRQFDSIGLVESWIANEIEAGYCGKYLFVTDGQICPMHFHKHKHETFFVVHGQVKVVFDGESVFLKEGDVLAVPPLSKHSFTGLGPALLLELSQPCVIDDNFFEDSRIPIGGNYKGNKNRCLDL
jgi:mannose-6-phosphate isomerase-like protein (cupin superfamily)